MQFTQKFKKFYGFLGIFLLILFNIVVALYFKLIKQFLLAHIYLQGIIFFLIGFFGTFGLFSPISYTYFTFFFSLIKEVNLILLTFFVSIGATFGEIVTWYFGKLFSYIIPEEKLKVVKLLIQKLEKTKKGKFLIYFTIILFALTPLPDDVLMIVLGTYGYSLIKTILFCFIGKFLLILSFSLGGRYFFTSFPIDENFALLLGVFLIFLFYFPLFSKKFQETLKELLKE